MYDVAFRDIGDFQSGIFFGFSTGCKFLAGS